MHVERVEESEKDTLSEKEIAKRLLAEAQLLAKQTLTSGEEKRGFGKIFVEQLLGQWQEKHGQLLEFMYSNFSQNDTQQNSAEIGSRNRYASLYSFGRHVGTLIIKHRDQYDFGQQKKESLSHKTTILKDRIARLIAKHFDEYVLPTGTIVNQSQKRSASRIPEDARSWLKNWMIPPFPSFRETMQFIEEETKKTFFLEEMDGSIVSEQNPFNSSYGYGKKIHMGKLIDAVTFPINKDFFPDTLSDFLARLHEYSHASRTGTMSQTHREAQILDAKENRNSTEILADRDEPRNIARMNRVISEEVFTSAKAIAIMFKIIEFLDIDTEENKQAIIEYFAIGLTSYFSRYHAWIDEVDIETDWSELPIDVSDLNFPQYKQSLGF